MSPLKRETWPEELKVELAVSAEPAPEFSTGCAFTVTEAAMAGAGVDIRLMAVDGVGEAETQRKALREQALRSDIGITGIDYAIAETGSVAIVARKGVSRLVSLVMPVHIAVVMRGQVLPSLDELFTLRRHDFNQGNLGSYMNIITGPSRSADIEQTIVKGVHGPREVHMVLVDR